MFLSITLLLLICTCDVILDDSFSTGCVKRTLCDQPNSRIPLRWTISDTEIHLIYEDMDVILDSVKKMIAVKPLNEDKCMVINGVENMTCPQDMGPPNEVDFSTMKSHKIRVRHMDNDELLIHVTPNVKTICRDNMEIVGVIPDEEPEPDTVTMLVDLKDWWPWWNWTPRSCSCQDSKWPCVNWPYWFYYDKYMYIITW